LLLTWSAILETLVVLRNFVFNLNYTIENPDIDIRVITFSQDERFNDCGNF
jgi:hypothetical protein